MPKRYNTPHRSHVVKTRLTDEEYADFTERLAPYGISQSEFLRQAIRRTTIRPVLHVSSVNDELLSAVGKLTAEYGRIGGNLNQIARTLNEWHSPYPAMAKELREAAADLAALKYEVLKKVKRSLRRRSSGTRASRSRLPPASSASRACVSLWHTGAFCFVCFGTSCPEVGKGGPGCRSPPPSVQIAIHPQPSERRNYK